MADATVTFAAKDLNLGSTIEKLKKELGSTESAAKDTSKGFDLSFGKIGLAAGVAGAAVKVGMMAIEGATEAARAVVEGFGQAIDLGGKLNDLSSRTGESAGNLLVLQRAFQNTGVEAEKVGPAINRLQKFLEDANSGGEEQNRTLTALGITYNDLAGKAPNEQMQILAERIGKITDPGQRAAAAMSIFGKTGGEILPVLANFGDEMDQAKSQLGSLPSVMDRSLAAFDSLGDSLGAIKTKSMEFAAGFMEAALPALNAFTASLAGVDAAGWGQKMMSMVLRIADTLMGAFMSPMSAIDALGSALKAYFLNLGNIYLNAFLTGGDFLRKFFSSELPGLIGGVLRDSLVLSYVNSAKMFVDSLNGVVKAFQTFLGDAISNIIQFFSSSFSRVITAFATDFKAAMSDPIGFITGKFDSALKVINENGALSFKQSYDEAQGTVLDKVSAGLGTVSAEYSQKLKSGTAAVQDEFGNLIKSIEPSAKDFFGATEATAKMKADFGKLEESGKGLRDKFNESQKEAEAGKNHAKSIAGYGDDFEKSMRGAKNNLSVSEALAKKIAEARDKDSIDKGGRIEKQAEKDIAAGRFSSAEASVSRLRSMEAERELRGVGSGRDNRNLSDIAKDYGLKAQNGETDNEFRQRILDARYGGAKPSTPSVDRPGRDGDKTAPGDKSAAKSGLDALVGEILKLVQKIEPKLPVAALTA